MKMLSKLYPLILLMADAAEGAEIDPLDVNVQDINTDYPILPAAVYDLRIDKAVKEPTKDGQGERLTISLATTTELKSEKGDPIAPGHTLKNYIGLTPKAAGVKPTGESVRAYTNSDIANNIAKIAKAAGLSESVRTIINNPAMLVGKVVRTSVGISKETEEFSRSNQIKSFEVVK